jgi:AbrB family looped-hinge helix DNA binding protein
VAYFCMHTVRVSSKGQVVIPKDVRKRHGLERDTDLVLIEEGDALVLRKRADVEKVLRDRFYPLLRAAEKSLAELWETPEDDVWNDA